MYREQNRGSDGNQSVPGERTCVETTLSMVTIVCDLKRIRNRLPQYIQARLAYVAAMFNILLDLFHHLHPEADPFKMSALNSLSKTSING